MYTEVQHAHMNCLPRVLKPGREWSESRAGTHTETQSQSLDCCGSQSGPDIRGQAVGATPCARGMQLKSPPFIPCSLADVPSRHTQAMERVQSMSL